MRIATGALRPRNDGSRKNLRVIPRPVRRLVVGSEPSAASGRGSEVSEWPRSKFPASAVRQRRNFGHRNRVIRNTPAQRTRRTDCHTSDIGHWFAMTHYKKCGVSPDGRTEASAPTEGLPIELRRGRRPRRPASVTRGAVRRAKKQNRPRLLPRTMRCTVVPPCFAACSRRRPYEVPLHFRAVTGAPVRA